MTARNDITGDAITNSKGNRSKYAQGWERIYGNKKNVKEETKADTDTKQKNNTAT